MPGPLIERYRERLSLAPGDPVVSLNEGSTPLVEAPVISERVGASVYLKLEGANPTGSFKDRGMTVAVSRAKGAGAEAIICASTGNTAASCAAYAARAGLRGAVIVPEGKIAIGKLAQALMHGARVIALRGNFDRALEIVRELAQRHPFELAASVAGILAHGLPAPEGGDEPSSVVCVLTGHGLKDPDTALGKAPPVIGCEAEVGAVERAVFEDGPAPSLQHLG